MIKIFLLGLKLFIVGIILILLLFLVVRKETARYIFNDVGSVPDAKTVLILGARVSPDGVLSAVLKHRVDTALLLYREGKVRNILMTGDNSRLVYDEVKPVREYLLSEGVSDEDIFLDHAGFDTYSSMYRARDIFLVDSMLIVSQSFHLPRAVFIARNLGIEAYGVEADKGEYYLRNYIREPFSNVKAVLNLLFNRQPKFLGEEIPIE